MSAPTTTPQPARLMSRSASLFTSPSLRISATAVINFLYKVANTVRRYFWKGEERIDAIVEMDSEIRFQQVDATNIQRMRSLNSVLFPVHYSASFYRGLLLPGQFAQLALYGNTYVGTIACRKQPLGFASDPSSTRQGDRLEVYMMTLGVLAPYRRLGLGKQLLQHALEYAAEDPMVCKMVLHVQIDNDDALRFYHKLGFSTVRMVERYYRTIDPPHAYLLECRIPMNIL